MLQIDGPAICCRLLAFRLLQGAGLETGFEESSARLLWDNRSTTFASADHSYLSDRLLVYH